MSKYFSIHKLTEFIESNNIEGTGKIIKDFPEIINQRIESGWTILMSICNNNNISRDSLKSFLICAGNADFNIQNNDGNTALHILSNHINFDSVYGKIRLKKIKLLLKYNIDVNIQNRFGKAVLHLLGY